MLSWLLLSTKYTVCGICGNCGNLGKSNLWKMLWCLKPKGFLLATSGLAATGYSFCFPRVKQNVGFTSAMLFAHFGARLAGVRSWCWICGKWWICGNCRICGKCETHGSDMLFRSQTTAIHNYIFQIAFEIIVHLCVRAWTLSKQIVRLLIFHKFNNFPQINLWKSIVILWKCCCLSECSGMWFNCSSELFKVR